MTIRITNKIKLALAGLLLLLSLVAAQTLNSSSATVSNGWNDSAVQEPGISILCDPGNEPCPTGGGG